MKRRAIIKPGHLTRQDWAKRISSQWKDACDGMLEAIFNVGRDLIEAREHLPHGQFIEMVEGDLPFARRSAQMLMAIVRDQRLTKAKSISLLPPHWGTLYKITRLSDETFERLIDDGTIRRDVSYADINKVLRIEKVKADEVRVLNLVPIIGKLRTLVFDPGWDYDWLSLAARAKPGYAMQSLDSLRALDVKAWADEEVGCHLYCWTTNNFLSEACKLVEHWGFQHRTVITWIKPPPFGLGSYYRNSTEQCLFATLGDTTTRPAAASIPTHFEAPRGEHSEKPEEFYNIVRAASYPPYGEANQRKARPDFTNLFVEQASEAAE